MLKIMQPNLQPYVFLNKLKAQRKGCWVLIGMILLSIEPEFVIDGVTAATTVAPTNPSPSLHLSATPTIINNAIRGRDGKPITINISGTDSNGFSSLLVGLVQNGYLYTDQNGLSLPSGATFAVNSSDPTKATFNWTPPEGTSTSSPKVILTFGALDTSGNTSKTQTITINVDDNLAPVFDESSMPVSQAVKVDTPLKIPVTVNPDPDNDNVIISHNGNLPAGAKLSKAVKNTNGQWVSQLSWTPNLTQIGTKTITFSAIDDKINPAQTTYPMDFVVGYVDAPKFDASMQTVQTAVENTKISFQVIVEADPYSNHVSISHTSLLPPGAKLSPAKKVNGKWISMMTWKPTAAQVGNSYPVTFSANDPAAGTTSAVTFDVTFNAVAK